MNEATKTRQLWGGDVLELLKGSGIDIGCGPDPILPGVERFDQEQGDANDIGAFVKKTYDFVFSSHTLEHMRDPRTALAAWWSLVKPGGHLIVIVPDEDLYEQGAFPSLFNRDHKHTFTIAKRTSWSPRSIGLFELARSLPGGEIKSLELQDAGYDRRLQRHAPGPAARGLFFTQKVVRKVLGNRAFRAYRFVVARFGSLVDQTDGDALAQIQLIVRRSP